MELLNDLKPIIRLVQELNLKLRNEVKDSKGNKAEKCGRKMYHLKKKKNLDALDVGWHRLEGERRPRLGMGEMKVTSITIKRWWGRRRRGRKGSMVNFEGKKWQKYASKTENKDKKNVKNVERRRLKRRQKSKGERYATARVEKCPDKRDANREEQRSTLTVHVDSDDTDFLLRQVGVGRDALDVAAVVLALEAREVQRHVDHPHGLASLRGRLGTVVLRRGRLQNPVAVHPPDHRRRVTCKARPVTLWCVRCV